MPSAAFSINGDSVTEYLASQGDTITLALLDSVGADTINWSVVGNHDPDSVTNPALSTSGSPAGSVATFTMPSTGYGQCYRVQCQINNGKLNKEVQAAYTKTAIIGVANINGILPFAAGETYERCPTGGTTKAINDLIAGNSSKVAASGKLTTANATATTIATIATSSEYQYWISATISSRQDSSSNSAFEHIRLLYTNKGGTLAQQGSTDSDALSYDAITVTGLSVSTSGTNILVRYTGAALTIRHEYLVEYVAMRIATS